MKSLPKKTPGRLNEHDHIQRGARFITINAVNYYALFMKTECESFTGLIRSCLTGLGKIVDYEIQVLSRAHEGVSVDNYVIMPNHVHMILRVEGQEPQSAADAARRAISGFKRAVSLKAGFSPWQKSYTEHEIRNRDAYWDFSHYIDVNPARA